jgi:hypothetical protein
MCDALRTGSPLDHLLDCRHPLDVLLLRFELDDGDLGRLSIAEREGGYLTSFSGKSERKSVEKLVMKIVTSVVG